MASVQRRRESQDERDESRAPATDKGKREGGAPAPEGGGTAGGEQGQGGTATHEGSVQASGVVNADKSAQGGEAKQTATTDAAAAGGSAGKSGDGDGEGRTGGKEGEGQGGVESEGMVSGVRGEGERVQEGVEVKQGGGKAEKAAGGGETEGGGGSVVEQEGETEEKGKQGGGEDVKGSVLPPTHVEGPSPATAPAYCAQRVAAGTQLTPAEPTIPHSAHSSSLYPLAAATNPFAMQLPSVAPTALPPSSAPPAAAAAPPALVAAPACAFHGMSAAPHGIPPGGSRMRIAGGMARTGGALSVGPADVIPVQPSVGVHGSMAGTGVHAQAAAEEAARVPHSNPEEHSGLAPMDVEEGKTAAALGGGSSHAGAAAAASHSGVPVVSLVSVLAGGGTDVAALTLFVGLLCACIVVGHVLEGVRWINDAVTAILFVSAHLPPGPRNHSARNASPPLPFPRLPAPFQCLRSPLSRLSLVSPLSRLSLVSPLLRLSLVSPLSLLSLVSPTFATSPFTLRHEHPVVSALRIVPPCFPLPYPSAPGPGVGRGGVVRAGRREFDDSAVRRGPVLHLPAASHHLQRRPIVPSTALCQCMLRTCRFFMARACHLPLMLSFVPASTPPLLLQLLPLLPPSLGVIFSATDSVSVLQCPPECPPECPPLPYPLLPARMRAILYTLRARSQVLDQEEQPLVYSLVFGEGVVNDATSIVLFRAVQQLALSPAAHALSLATLLNVLSDFLYLFTASTLLGVALGLLSAYVMKTLYFSRYLLACLTLSILTTPIISATQHPTPPLHFPSPHISPCPNPPLPSPVPCGTGSHATDREIALMALMAYASYILAEVLRLSGILSVFFAGIVMSHYTWHNVTESSRVTTKHAFATMSFIAETVIFMYVGMDALDSEKWTSVNVRDTFVLFTLLLGLVLAGRAAFVFPLSALLNLQRKNSRALRTPHQVRALGRRGGRWGVGFSEEGEATAAMLIASTIALVLFSTLVFGLLTSPLIDYFLPFTLHHSASNYSEGPSSPKYLPPHPISPASTTLFLAASPSLPPSRSRPFSSSTPVTSVSSAPSLPVAPSAPDAAPAVPSAPVRATPPRPRLLYPHGAAGHVEGDMVVCLPASSMAGLPMPDARLASRILSAHERDLHDLWRWLDDTYMRPLFGGRGYVPPAARSSSFSLPRSSSGLAGAAARMLLQGGGGGSMFERLDARAAVGREEEGEVREGEGEEGDGLGRGSRRTSFVRFADEIGEERREGRGRLEEEGDAVEGECLAEDDVAWPHKMGHNLPHHPHQLHHHHHHHHQHQQQHHQGNQQQQHEGQRHGGEWEGEGEAPWRIGEEHT
ncbi:unnamed protein product [Closterium sp. Naga37s-1]|nr:unnamed protein product [Closterium sp. Naga37s-1]